MNFNLSSGVKPFLVGALLAAASLTNAASYQYRAYVPGIQSAACTLPWGGTLAPNSATTGYTQQTVSYGSSCTSVSQALSCSGGALVGTAPYGTCSVRPADWERQPYPGDYPGTYTQCGSVPYLSTDMRKVNANNCHFRSVASHKSGKWYFELTINSSAGGTNALVILGQGSYYDANSTKGVIAWAPSGWLNYWWTSQGFQNTTGISGYGAGSVLGFAVDLDSQSVKLSVNGVSQGTYGINRFQSAWSASGNAAYVETRGTNGANSVTANFGDEPFAYPVPAGYTGGW